MRTLLIISLCASIGGLLTQVIIAWLLPDDAVRGCKPVSTSPTRRVRCDGGEGQTPLITERDEYE